MKKILLVLLSVCGCVAWAQKNAPLTRAWATHEPVTNSLVTNVPVSNAPATNALTTHAMIMNALATQAPVTNKPATTASIVSTPTVNTPVVNTPVVNAPVVSAPVVNTPVVNTPVVNAPVVNTPVVNAPVVNTPVVNAPATNKPATNAPAEPIILNIISDSMDADLNLRQVVYHSHVRVTDAQMRLTCEQLTAIFPTNKAPHLEQVLAETNVVIDFTEQGEKYHVTAAQAVYVYSVVNAMTNETVTLTGNPKVLWGATDPLTGEPMSSMTGEPIFYSRVNKQKGSFHATNEVIHFVQPPAGTNTDIAPIKLF
jgi:lipopolysaccharide export system protein LptA